MQVDRVNVLSNSRATIAHVLELTDRVVWEVRKKRSVFLASPFSLCGLSQVRVFNCWQMSFDSSRSSRPPYCSPFA
jgi:hypothetical protein